MLKLDEETRDIPVLTYTSEYDGQEQDDEDAGAVGARSVPARPRPAVWMN